MKIDNFKEKIGTMIKSKDVDGEDTDKKGKAEIILKELNIDFDSLKQKYQERLVTVI